MNNSVLKKEFKSNDLNRIRNLITKKFGDNTKTQIGYEQKQTIHVEGDEWEENGKKWKIKNGLKISNSRLGLIKTPTIIPICCPKCSGPLKTPLDKKFYKLDGRCFECLIKYETKLKIEGKYEEYERNKIIQNFNSQINEAEEFIKEINNESTDYVTENGDLENWGKANNDFIIRQNTQKIKESKQLLNNFNNNVK